mmetsp:Transcript_42272/g.101754  ORF Transcript_42272/g.101754 Transcript_42272/m.101754 type:complete len:567 (+) Transcript_42272:312-2012(+)
MEDAAAPVLGGADIAEVMKADGPVVKCVLLRCRPKDGDGDDSANDNSGGASAGGTTMNGGNNSKPPPDATDATSSTAKPPRTVLTDMIDEIEVDTTPNKSEVQKLLGGPVTFLGQYHEERTVLMTRVFPSSIEEIVAHFSDECDEEEADGGDGDGDGDGDENKDLKTPDAQDILQEMTVGQLRDLCSDRGIDTDGMVEKRNLVDALLKYDESLPPYNPNQLQPPLHKKRVRGDIIVMRVAETEEELDDDDDADEDGEGQADADTGGGEEQDDSDAKRGEVNAADEKETKADGDKKPAAVEKSGIDDVEKNDDIDGDSADPESKTHVSKPMKNEEFFQDYTKANYIQFASRTDIEEYEIEEPQEEGHEVEDVEDEDDDQDENEAPEDGDENAAEASGNPDEEELDDEDRNAMFNMVMNEVLRQYREETGRGPNTQELLDMRANIARELGVEIAHVEDGDWTQKAKADTPSSGKKIAFDTKDRVKEFVPHENEHTYEHNDDDEEDDEDYVQDLNLQDGDGDEDGKMDENDKDVDAPPAKKLKTSPKPEEEVDGDHKDVTDGDSKPPST